MAGQGRYVPMTNRVGQPDRSALSLEQIERKAWGDPPADATRLIRTAHELRRKPIDALTAEDLRLLIGQQIGVNVLLPRALVLLADDPLTAGDMYPGDLLNAAMRLPPEHWAANLDQATALRTVAQAARQLDPDLHEAIDRFLSLTEHHTRKGPRGSKAPRP
jgi:CDI immunity proteins